MLPLVEVTGLERGFLRQGIKPQPFEYALTYGGFAFFPVGETGVFRPDGGEFFTGFLGSLSVADTEKGSGFGGDEKSCKKRNAAKKGFEHSLDTCSGKFSSKR